MKAHSFLLLLLAVPCQLFAGEAPLGMTRFNVQCPAPRLLPVIDAAYHECNNGYENGSCAIFVSLFDQLLPEYDCQRSFDHSPDKDYVVPAVWLAGAAHEDFLRLLSTLKQPQARCLFGSAKLRATLDGHLAEEYLDKSERVGKKMRGSCSGP